VELESAQNLPAFTPTAEFAEVRLRQAGILCSIFKRSMIIGDRALFPHIKKSAFITSEARLIIDDKDPFAWGIRP
jgi:proline racemase